MIINLTPHTININDLNIPSSGVARLEMQEEKVNPVEGVPVYEVRPVGVSGLPDDHEEGTYYVVSTLVKEAFPNRTDLLSPGHLLRDEHGRVIGCKSLFR